MTPFHRQHDPWATWTSSLGDKPQQPDGGTPTDQEFLLDGLGHPSIRAAMREWLAGLIATTTRAALVHATARLLDVVVSLFAHHRGSLPSELVQNHVYYHHRALYDTVIVQSGRYRRQSPWHQFVNGAQPVLELVRCDHADTGLYRVTAIVLACRDRATWDRVDADQRVRHRRALETVLALVRTLLADVREGRAVRSDQGRSVRASCCSVPHFAYLLHERVCTARIPAEHLRMAHGGSHWWQRVASTRRMVVRLLKYHSDALLPNTPLRYSATEDCIHFLDNVPPQPSCEG